MSDIDFTGADQIYRQLRESRGVSYLDLIREAEKEEGEKRGLLSDIGNLLWSGTKDMAADVMTGAEQMTNSRWVADDELKASADETYQRVSPEWRERIDNAGFQDENELTLSGAAGQALKSIPSILGFAPAAAMGPEGAAAYVGALSGAMIGGGSYNQTMARLKAVPDEDLVNSPLMDQYHIEEDRRKSGDDDAMAVWKRARMRMEQDLSKDAMTGGAIVGTLSGALLGPALGKIFRGGQGALQGARQGALTESQQEFVESGVETYGVERAIAEVENRPTDVGRVLRGGAWGATLGAGVGGTVGGTIGAVTPKKPTVDDVAGAGRDAAKEAGGDSLSQSLAGSDGLLSGLQAQNNDALRNLDAFDFHRRTEQPRNMIPIETGSLDELQRMRTPAPYSAPVEGEYIGRQDSIAQDKPRLDSPVIDGEFTREQGEKPFVRLADGRFIDNHSNIVDKAPAEQVQPTEHPERTRLNDRKRYLALPAPEAKIEVRQGPQEALTDETIESGESADPKRKLARVNLTELTLSEDIPQFKSGANKDGVVEQLQGEYDETGMAPVQVWVRNDGRKELITGRHRADLARRSGQTDIPAQLHYEKDGFTAEHGKALDAILNIRDNQGSVKDYVRFFENAGVTRDEADRLGITARQLGRRAYTIAEEGSPGLIAALHNDQIKEEAAEAIARVAPKDEALQAVGLKALQEGKPNHIAVNMIRAVQTMRDSAPSMTQEGDLFGFDESAMKQAEDMARIASSKQRQLQERISAVKGAAKKPELARNEGVDVKDPASLTRRIAELTQQAEKYKEWHKHPEILAEIRNEAGANAVPSTPPAATLPTRDEPAPQTFTLEPQTGQSIAQNDARIKQVAAQEASLKREQELRFDAVTTYPKTMKFVDWAMKNATETVDTIEYNGKTYHKITRTYNGNIGGRGKPLRDELKSRGEKISLINDEHRQLIIQIDENTVSDRGKIKVVDIAYRESEQSSPAVLAAPPPRIVMSTGKPYSTFKIAEVAAKSKQQYDGLGDYRIVDHKTGFAIEPIPNARPDQSAASAEPDTTPEAQPARATQAKTGERRVKSLDEVLAAARRKDAVFMDFDGVGNGAKLEADTGIRGLSGYTHGIDSKTVNHILAKHGREETEAPRGQIPVTLEDIRKIPDIVTNYDSVEKGKDAEERKLPLDTLIYRKAYNGTTYFVEEIRTGRGKLFAKTMWKIPTTRVATKTGDRQTSETTEGDLPHQSLHSGTDKASSQVLPANTPAASSPAQGAVNEPNPGYTDNTSTVGEPENERTTGGIQSRKSADSDLQNGDDNLFTAAALSPEQRERSYEDTYHTIVKSRQVQTIKIGVDRVISAGDAAHVVAPYRKHAQETVLAIVTDGDGKVLQVIRHTKGHKDSSDVDPATLAGAVLAVKGAKGVWFAHNHPSGVMEASKADINITLQLAGLLDGTSVAVRGHVILGRGANALYFKDGYDDRPIKITPALRNRTIPITERVLITRTSERGIANFNDAAEVVRRIKSPQAIVLLNLQNQPIATLAVDAQSLKKLMGTGQIERLLTAIEKSNASSAIFKDFAYSDDSRDGFENLAKFFNAAKINVLDYIYAQDLSAAPVSGARTHDPVVTTSSDTYYKSANEQVTTPVSKLTLQAVIARVTKAWADKDSIVPVDTYRQLPEEIRADARKRGVKPWQIKGVYHKGRIYLVRENLGSMGAVERALLHEGYGHMGLRRLLGEQLDGLMSDLFHAVGGNRGVRLIARDYGIYIGNYEMLSSSNKNSMIAEELLAHLAEHNKPSVKRLVKEIIGQIRQWLRTKGFLKLSAISDSELLVLLKQARGAMKGGNAASGYSASATAFSLGSGKGPTRLQNELHRTVVDDNPAYISGNVSITLINKHQTVEHDFDESKRLPDGHISHIEDGAVVWDAVAAIYDGEKDQFAGTLTVQVLNGRIIAIHNIKVQNKGNGAGEKIVASILASNPEGVRIIEAIPSAKGFWDKMGTGGFYDLYNNTEISWADYERARAKRDQQRSSGELQQSGNIRPKLPGNDEKSTTDGGVSGKNPTSEEEHAALDELQKWLDDQPMFSLAPDPHLDKFGLGAKQKRRLIDKINRAVAKENENSVWSLLKHRAYEGNFDGLIGIDRAEKAVGVTDIKDSGYVGVRLATGIADIMNAILHYGAPRWNNGVLEHRPGTKGLLEILGKAGKDLHNYLAWVGAHRAEELIVQGRENNLTQADIAALKARALGKEALFNEIHNEYKALNNAMLDLAESSGLITSGERQKWGSEWYIPFYRQGDSDSDMLLAPRTKRGLSHQTSGIKRLRGGDTATNDLLENILTNWLKLADASVKNSALLKTVDNLKTHPEYLDNETMRFSRVIVPRSEVVKRIKGDREYLEYWANSLGMSQTATELEVAHELNKLSRDGFEELFAITEPKDPDIIKVRRNGKSEFYRVNDPALLRAITHLNAPGFNDPVTKAGRYLKRLLTNGVTASPDFMLRNFIRDAVHAWAINPDGFAFGADSVKGIKNAFNEDADYRAMMFAGASFQGGYVHGTDPEASAHIIRRALEAKGLSPHFIHAYENSLLDTPAKAWDAIKQGWQTYRGWGDKVENSNRLSVYKAAIKAGKSPLQAAFEAKDLMDYSLRGNYILLQYLTDLVPFMNARLQGMSKLVRAAHETPRRVLVDAGLKIAAFSFALAMFNDDDERYKELPDWDKDANWHFWIDDQHWRVPKPFEIGIVFGTMPERIYHTMSGSQENEKLWWSVKHNLWHTLAINPTPQFALPIIESVANRQFFFDRPIEGMSDAGKLPYARYDERTSTTMRELGEFVGLSPKKLEHMLNGYLGTIGMYSLGIADMFADYATGRADKPARKLEDMPVIKVLYRGDAARSTQYTTDIYDRWSEIDDVFRTINAYKNEGRDDEAAALHNDNAAKLRHRRKLGEARQKLGDIKKRIDQISRSTLLSADTKRKQIDTLTERRNTIAKHYADLTSDSF